MQEVAPPKAKLEQYIREGLTQQQMADRWSEEGNVSITRSTIAMAMSRYGLKSARPRDRYTDMIPWTLRTEHTMAAETRLLRLEARRRRGDDISERDRVWLSNWLTELDKDQKVLIYDDRTPRGWWYLPRTDEDDDIIRRPETAEK